MRRNIVISLLDFRPGRSGGSEAYLRELVPRLPRAAPEHEWILLCHRDVASRFRVDARVVPVPWSPSRLAASRYLGARPLRSFVESLRPDVCFFPQPSHVPKEIRGPAVLTVHDLAALNDPRPVVRGLRAVDRKVRSAATTRSLAQVERVIAVSQFTRDELLRRFPIGADRVTVIHHGMSQAPLSAPPARAILEDDYLYYPAVTAPHKNHTALLQAMAALRREGNFPYRLVLSGRITPYWSTLRRRIRRLGLDDRVEHRGWIPWAEVCQLFQRAAAVVIPSLYEGFGLSVYEAVQRGKKVVVSDLPVFGEIGVPRDCRINFARPEQLRAALDRPGPTTLTRPVDTWEDCARRTAQLLIDVAG